MNNETGKKVVAVLRRYKILHVAFWTWQFFSSYHLFVQMTPNSKTLVFDTINIIGVEMCCVYFMTGYLMPHFLRKRKYLLFFVLTIADILVSALLYLGIQDVYLLAMFGRHLHTYAIPILFASHVTDTFILLALFFAVYTVEHWFNTERRNNMLEKERLRTELNFLKAQMNPHFLFNVINSVYVLMDEDKQLASETLLQFSALLRYQLYDCANELTPFNRELEFLHDYVGLERLRLGNSIAITFNSDAADDSLQIAPFILIPFIENAIKHRSHKKSNNYLLINVVVRDNNLDFMVENTYDEPLAEAKDISGGIGLVNVQRRLELLYKDRYKMEVKKEDDIYSMNLKLNLRENTMHTV